jgi:hypothetical protein
MLKAVARREVDMVAAWSVDRSGAQKPPRAVATPRGIVCSPPPRYRLSVSTCAAKVRASLLKARNPHHRRILFSKKVGLENDGECLLRTTAENNFPKKARYECLSTRREIGDW